MHADGVDLRPLGWARAAFGVVFLLRTTPVLAYFDVPLTRGMGPLLGWPDAAWALPVGGLVLPAKVVMMLCVARTIAAVALTLGVASRPAGLVAGIAGYLVLAQDALGYFHHLHMLFLGAILLGLTDAGSAFALRPDAPRAPRSSKILLRLWIGSIYLWAAIGKLRPDWIDGRALALFLRLGALEGGAARVLLATPVRCAMIACTVVVLELAIGAGLLWRRSRVVALGAAAAMHLTFEVVGHVDSIGWQMAALLLVFVPITARSEHSGQATRPATARTSHRT